MIGRDCTWSMGRGAIRRTGDCFEGDLGMRLKSITGAEGQMGTDWARRDLEGVSRGLVGSRIDDADGGRRGPSRGDRVSSRKSSCLGRLESLSFHGEDGLFCCLWRGEKGAEVACGD